MRSLVRSPERKAALELGQTFYENGKPCPNGHTAPRRTINAKCTVCEKLFTKPKTKDQMRAARGRQKERRDSYMTTYREMIRNDPDRLDRQREQQRRSKAKYYPRDKPKILAQNRKRRAIKEGSDGSHTDADIDRIRILQGGRCAYCRHRLRRRQENVDHIEPLAKGGSNHARNLQILCRPCNNQKAALDPIHYARRIGRLI